MEKEGESALMLRTQKKVEKESDSDHLDFDENLKGVKDANVCANNDDNYKDDSFFENTQLKRLKKSVVLCQCCW